MGTYARSWLELCSLTDDVTRFSAFVPIIMTRQPKIRIGIGSYAFVMHEMQFHSSHHHYQLRGTALQVEHHHGLTTSSFL